MSSLYLFRHGQAGTRDNYDTLSDLGHRQASLLGGHVARQELKFAAFFTGELRRQRETAAAIIEAGAPLPAPIADAHWNEFDLTAVYDGIAPQVAADDPEFRRHYEALEAAARDRDSAVHRQWTASDIAVVRAWVEGRYTYPGESWRDFTERVRGAFAMLREFGPGEAVAVSTSATPIAVWMGLALELQPRHILRSAGAIYNSSVTSFRIKGDDVTLFSFNQIAHLTDPATRTFR